MSISLDPAVLAQVSTDCACFNLRRTARAITQLYDRAVAETGLRATQSTVLVAVAQGTLHGGIPISRLAEILGMDKTTLSRNLTPLRRRKLVELKAGADARSKRALLTDQGEAMLQRVLPLWAEVQGKVAGRIGKEGWATFRSDLEHLNTLAQEAT